MTCLEVRHVCPETKGAIPLIRMIACEMLRDELELAMAQTGVRPETVWLDKGLHDTPQNLRETLQRTIDALPPCDTILLAMALCGGAMDGITSPRAMLAVPRFDDCIRMLLSVQPGLRNAADPHSLYFTRQWMDSDGHILRERSRYVQRYGEKKAKKIMHLMLANYESYRLVDTGAYDLAAWQTQARRDAAELGLAYGTQKGSVRVLEKLLRQEFDEEILVIRPGETLKQGMFLNL